MTNPLSDQAPAQSASYGEKLAYIIGLYQDGIAGNKQAVREANVLLERLRREYPGRPLADAYHGVIMIVGARDNPKPRHQLKWIKKGLKLLDNAVSAAPRDLMVRLLRGKTTFRLPEDYFGRTATAIEDYAFLLDHESDPSNIISAEERLKLLDELGDAYYRIGRNKDAENSWRRLEQQEEFPEYRQLAKQKLQSVEGQPPIRVINTQPSVSVLPIVLGIAVRVTGKSFMEWMRIDDHRGRKSKKR